MTLLFFAQCAEWAGTRRRESAEAGPVAVKNLPELAFLGDRMDFVKVAVNRRLSSWDTEVRYGDEIAVMPPFSGG